MSDKILFISILLLTSTAYAGGSARRYKTAPPSEPVCCGEVASPMRLGIRHIEPKGIGYNDGYTTLEAFLAYPSNCNSWLGFLDLRGHIFDNARAAANAGLGLRYVESRIWGINAYYDYRNTKRLNYNQVGVGLESLGELWDFRINGYLPLGTKTSDPFSPAFYDFSGNTLRISYKREFALADVNAEVGFHADVNDFDFYLAAGPYYLTSSHKSAWGGEGRVVVDWNNLIQLQGNVSYDTLFKWIGQGQIGITVPLGKKIAVKQKPSECCKTTLALKRRASQRVDRNEIIPISNKQYETGAINPLTGLAYTFWFVNNTSSSLGTIESPFPTLLQAQNASSPYDVIYVFPGNGTSTGMDSGINLQNNQMLLGSATPYSFGTQFGSITIPTFTTTMPLLTNVSGPAVTLNDNNTVSGLHIDVSIPGVLGSGITNATIAKNNFTTPTVQTSVELDNISGTLSLYDNTFSTTVTPSENSYGVFVTNTDSSATLNLYDNTFTNHGGAGIAIVLDGASTGTVLVANNIMTAPIGFEGDQLQPPINVLPGPYGFYLLTEGTTQATASVFNNKCFYQERAGLHIYTQGSSTVTSTVENNYLEPGVLVPITGPNASFGIGCLAKDDSVHNTTISSNIITASKTSCLGFATFSTQDVSVTITNNIVSGGGGGVGPGNTFIGAGITVGNENISGTASTGNVRAVVTGNRATDSGPFGGFLTLNFPLAGPTGFVCLRTLNNYTNSDYVIYNGAPNGIFVEEGYQSNVGTMIDNPDPILMPTYPVVYVPANTCN
ncbi:MAG: inverse autotransporter beta domain-containing protein [Verrucomicrobia bacterium]|nr:inverse autotransporter beta domain-containing protein [Verrucomicrobiota bacterium]